MYFTTANADPGPLLTHTRSGALAILLALGVCAAPGIAAAARLLPLDQAADTPVRKSPRHGKKPAAKATVITANAENAPAAAPVVAPAAGGDRWEIVVADRTLNAALARWAAAAGWQLLWELPVDYAVQAHTTVPGKFEDAVTLVVNSMEGAEIPMKAIFYSGNKVLRIMPKGAQ